MDPLHVCIALGPVAMYLLVLGAINLSRRPLVVSGGRDLLALGLAVSGLIAAGPMELFLPEWLAVQLGGWVWALMLGAYALLLSFLMLMMRPRIVVYNCTYEQLRQALMQVAARLDPNAHWTGETVNLFPLGVQLHLESQPMLKNMQLVSSGPDQNLAGWKRLEIELAAALRALPGMPNPYGISLLSFGLAMAGAITYWLARDPAAVQHALNEMLRRR